MHRGAMAIISAGTRRPSGPLTITYWARILDPFDELDQDVRLSAAARVRRSYAAHLGRFGAHARVDRAAATSPR